MNQREEAFKAWKERFKWVEQITAQGRTATEATPEKQARIRRLQTDYNAFCEYYFPHYLQRNNTSTNTSTNPPGTNPSSSVGGDGIATPTAVTSAAVSQQPQTTIVHNAPFHTAAARKVKNTPNLKAVFMWPRGHAKSTHFDIFIPLWLIFQQQPLIHFMVVVGKSYDSATRLLGDIQGELQHNRRIEEDFGPQVAAGDWQEGEFTTKRGIHFIAVGRGQSPRGLRERQARPDYIVIDDLDDDELCRNERRVREMTEWVKEALFGALDVGRGRFIMVGNLIAKCSVLANLVATKGVHVSKVCAVDDNGNPVWKDKWTKQEAQLYRDFVGYRAWEKEMMHNPITEGAIFKAEWIIYKKCLPIQQYDDIVCYTDPSLKPKTTNDYKACRLWGRKGHELHLIDCFVRQGSLSAMVTWLYELYERTRDKAAIRFYIEANFWQDTVLDEFEREGDARGYQLPIMPDKRKKPDKLARIEAIAPLWERGYVFYNEALKDSQDMKTGIEQTLGLERGSAIHDDAPDADEGAIWLMMRNLRSANPAAVTLRPRHSRTSW